MLNRIKAAIKVLYGVPMIVNIQDVQLGRGAHKYDPELSSILIAGASGILITCCYAGAPKKPNALKSGLTQRFTDGDIIPDAVPYRKQA